MQFSWKKAIWKVVKTAGVAAGAGIVMSGSVDPLIDAMTNGAVSHVPVYVAPLVLSLITLGRNYLKQWAASQATENK